MTAMRKIEIELPEHLAEAIDRQVADGDYVSPSDAIVHALEDTPRNDPVVEHWLRAEVLPTIERRQREQTQGIPIEQIMEELKARRAARDAAE
jgi:Arc/MetJ-type ribon-helix-helix transcriptional regulator